MGRLRAYFARLGNPMQDCHLRKEPALRAFLPAHCHSITGMTVSPWHYLLFMKKS